jgi:hypothetical protein
MVSLVRHSMVTEDDEHRVIVHSLNDPFYYLLNVSQFPLDLWMVDNKFMSSVVEANQVPKEEPIVLRIKLLKHIFLSISVVVIQVANIEGGLRVGPVKAILEHAHPNKISRENDFLITLL